MKSVIHDEFASGTFLHARAQALSTKSLTESLYAPFASVFSSFLTLKKTQNKLNMASSKHNFSLQQRPFSAYKFL